MANSNCLEGIRCPKCFHEERFFISGLTIFEVYDEGTHGHTDISWDGDHCRCPKCGFTGKLAEFRTLTAQETERLVENITQDCYNDAKVLRDLVEGHVAECYDLSSYRSYFEGIDPDDEEEDT
jgi:hypothetical protein